jgi:hypothetical protein
MTFAWAHRKVSTKSAWGKVHLKITPPAPAFAQASSSNIKKASARAGCAQTLWLRRHVNQLKKPNLGG